MVSGSQSEINENERLEEKIRKLQFVVRVDWCMLVFLQAHLDPSHNVRELSGSCDCSQDRRATRTRRDVECGASESVRDRLIADMNVEFT